MYTPAFLANIPLSLAAEFSKVFQLELKLNTQRWNALYLGVYLLLHAGQIICNNHCYRSRIQALVKRGGNDGLISWVPSIPRIHSAHSWKLSSLIRLRRCMISRVFKIHEHGGWKGRGKGGEGERDHFPPRKSALVSIQYSADADKMGRNT